MIRIDCARMCKCVYDICVNKKLSMCTCAFHVCVGGVFRENVESPFPFSGLWLECLGGSLMSTLKGRKGV